MKKLIATLLIMCSLVLTGCGATEKMTDASESKRLIYERQTLAFDTFAYIITDTRTDEQFLFVRSGGTAGLTKMED